MAKNGEERFLKTKFLWHHRKTVGVIAAGLTIAVASLGHDDKTPNADFSRSASAEGTYSSTASHSSVPPSFDAAAGRFNEQHLEGAVSCSLRLVRTGGSLAVNTTLDPAVHGAWATYVISSRSGEVRGTSATEDFTVTDAGDVIDGRVPRIHVTEHYPLGDRLKTAECAAAVPGYITPPAS